MPDLLAVVSKAVFERDAGELAPGDTWPTARYASTAKALASLVEGGRLFLVTVRPPDEALWLVAILEQPKFDGSGWKARANSVAIKDVTGLRDALEFANGAKLPTKPGVLAMSLQTPRALATEAAAALAAAKAPKAGSAAQPAPRRTAREPARPAPPSVTIDQATLLARWRKTRSPNLADVLQAVPVDAKWTERLAELRRAKPSKAAGRIRDLPDDPRVTVFLVECVEQARWPGSSADRLWDHAFAKLVALGDSRAIAPLRACVANPPRFMGAAFTAQILAQIGATADALARRKPKADPGEAALLAANPVTIPAGGWLQRAKISGDAERWLATVWAAPDDDAVRAVAADALLELGDPRGELISMQLLGGAQAEVDALIRKHGKRFAGPIAEVGAVSRMTFERGFVTTCVIGRDMVGRRWWEEVARAPHWATVRSVKLGSPIPRWWFAAWVANAPVPSLREIVIGSVVVRRASQTAPWAIASAPQRPNGSILAQLGAWLAALPKAERDRIPSPASVGIRNRLASLA